MPYNILLNSSNVTGISKSTYIYRFIAGSFAINENSKICVSQIIIPYSWFNISSAYANNVFAYIINGITYSVTIPDGFYSINDYNNYIQQIMIQNNHYCIDTSTGNYVYFIYLYTNTTYYSNQFIVSPIIPSNSIGYTFPSGYVNTSGSNYATPQIVFTTNNNMLGFSSGVYPSSPSTLISLNFLSNIVPVATTVNSIVVRCNLVKNDCTLPTDILDTFYINAKFGSNITYQPSYEKWVDLASGRYESLVITLVDQNLNTIYMNDSNITISLLIDQGSENIQTVSTKPIEKTIEKIKWKNSDVIE